MEGILHVDMNNFYASVETLFAPEYQNVPMAVAGDKESRHGIILAKNNIAKQYGVKTAEAIWQAQRKCPGLVLVPPHHERYREYSVKAWEIYEQYTDQIESFGIDECWLDVSGSHKLFGSGEDIAHVLRKRIKKELGLTVSVGVSFNKIFAKLGSDYKKPDAVTVFSRENYRDVVWPLSARELLFVGQQTANTLAKFGIHTIGDLAQSELGVIKRILGKNGEMLWHYANGEDRSQVRHAQAQEDAKTIGNSTTLPRDIRTEQEIRNVFLQLAESVAGRLRKHGMKCKELQISIRSRDFQDLQRQCKLERAVCDSDSLYQEAMKLFKKTNCKWEIRSLGLRGGHLTRAGEVQLSLFEDEAVYSRKEELETAMDHIRERYGEDIVKRALFYDNKEEKQADNSDNINA